MKILAFASVLITLLMVSGCTTKIPLSLQIDSPEDGAEFSVNVQKVSGVVSDPGAAVKVNGVEARVDQNGDFYAYIEFDEGENTIKAEAIRGRDNYVETLIATFTPALSVYLDFPNEEEGVDYTKTPITMTGYVSDTEANVTVNGNQAQVAEDGSFSAQVKLEVGSNRIEATATLDGKEDSMYWVRNLGSDGLLGPPGPGQGIQYRSEIRYDHDIQLKAGETKLLDVILDVRKGISSQQEFNCIIFRVDEEYAEDELPALDGLAVNVALLNFTAYPNTVYQLAIIIETTSELAPGKYYFRFEQHLEDGFRGGGWIAVTVEG